MTDMGDDFRASREHQRNLRWARENKFERDWPFIAREARALGWTLRRGHGGSWDFWKDSVCVRWWPGSGKTATGQRFDTWPKFKAYLQGG